MYTHRSIYIYISIHQVIILVLNGVWFTNFCCGCWFQEREAKEAQAGDVLNVESEVRDQVMSHEPRVHRKKLKEVLDSLQAVLVGPGCSSCYTSRPCWYLVVTYVQSLLSCNAGAFRQQFSPGGGLPKCWSPSSVAGGFGSKKRESLRSFGFPKWSETSMRTPRFFQGWEDWCSVGFWLMNGFPAGSFEIRHVQPERPSEIHTDKSRQVNWLSSSDFTDAVSLTKSDLY